MMQFFKKADHILYLVLKNLALICMAGLLVILIFNVFFRFVPILSAFPNFSMGWFDEIVEFLFAWMVFTTASLLTRSREHFRVDILQRKLGDGKLGMGLELLIDLASILFLLVFLYFSWQLTLGGIQVSQILQLPKKYFYFCLPFNFAIMLIYTVRNVVVHAAKFLAACGARRPAAEKGADVSSARPPAASG